MLQRWITEAERTSGVAVARQQRWVSFMVLAAMLERVRADDGNPLCMIKGGVAMELRFDQQARSTKHLDLAVRADPDELVARLKRSPRCRARRLHRVTPHRRAGAQHRSAAHHREAQLPEPAWASVVTELAPAEAGLGEEIDWVSAKPLDYLGLDGPAKVPCVAVRWQIAQKLHACTQQLGEAGDGNTRYRDLIDILMLWDLVTPGDRPRVRDACVQLFDGRQAHPWPPRLEPPDHWTDAYRNLAAETAFPLA